MNLITRFFFLNWLSASNKGRFFYAYWIILSELIRMKLRLIIMVEVADKRVNSPVGRHLYNSDYVGSQVIHSVS